MKSAALLLVFNRPEPTRRVLEAVRAARPPRLYVAADGPRPGRADDASRCDAVRRLVLDGVDWPCEVRTLLREDNLGCRRAVSGAVSWFFEHESEGIVLEDDCVPAPDFFRFCDAALERWRDDERVMHVGGHQLVDADVEDDALFSRLVPIWGWATWRRAWRHFDAEMTQLPRLAELPLAAWYGTQHRAVRRAIERIHEERVDAWGARWVLAVLAAQGHSVLPRVNLVSNIGFGPDATHTTVDSHVARRPTGRLADPLRLPVVVQSSPRFDEASLRVLNSPWPRARRVLARWRDRVLR